MGTTPNGLPYPEPTAPVAGGADAIKALAQALRIATGIATIPPGTVAGNVVVAVTFPAGLFTTAPAVVASPSGSTVTPGPSAITATGCSVACLFRDTAGNNGIMPSGVNLRWIAIQL